MLISDNSDDADDGEEVEDDDRQRNDQFCLL